MSEHPIKTCQHCGATGEMPTFMSGETTCYKCLKKGERRSRGGMMSIGKRETVMFNTEFKLEDFCPEHDCREHLRKPFNDDNYSYATCGRIAIRVARNAEHPEGKESILKTLAGAFEAVDARSFSPLPAFEIPEKPHCETCCGGGKAELQTCPECEGLGRIDLDSAYNTYFDIECKTCGGNGDRFTRVTSAQCPTCNGEGKSYGDSNIIDFPDLGMSFQMILLDRVRHLNGFVVSANEEPKGIIFRFDEGYGILMPCRS